MFDKEATHQSQTAEPQAQHHDEPEHAREQAEQRSLDFARDDAAAMKDEEAAPDEEAEWTPSTDKTETKLSGTYGDYVVKHGFSNTDDGWSYEAEITMKPNAKAKADKIGWIQVVRRSKSDKGGWATAEKDKGMDAERAKRTDQKTGWRVDRKSAITKKTPFYGMDKGTDGKLTATNNTKIGKHGGDDPYLWDRPGLFAKDQMQFLSTATDMATGTQYDAISWGCTYDKAAKIAIGETPAIVKAGDERMAGRDIAINKWNSDVAKGDIDKVPTTVDPGAIAQTVVGALTLGTDEDALRQALKGITNTDVKMRVKAAYKALTGSSLYDDLWGRLRPEELKEFDAWK
jgi:hypothetical protein